MRASAPAALIMFATSLAPMDTRGLSLRSWRAQPKYGITAITLLAEARFAASIDRRSSMRLSVGGKVDCRMKQVAPRTLSAKKGTNSPSLKWVTSSGPSTTSGSSGPLSRFMAATTFSEKYRVASQVKMAILCLWTSFIISFGVRFRYS